MRGFLSVALVTLTGIPAVSCGGDVKQLEMGPIPPSQSTGTFTGALCKGVECSCASDTAGSDGGVGVPEGDAKRFEIRLSSPYELWASGPGVAMYKTKEIVEKCFYVDLAAKQEHTFRLRASNPHGAAATITMRELGTKTKAWYETFKWTCGNPGACSFQELEANKAELSASTNKNVFDKCGSVKVKNVVWDTGKSPDQQHPAELVLQFTLDVYKFVPEWPPGDPNCGKRRPKEAGGSESTPEPTVEPAPSSGSGSASP